MSAAALRTAMRQLKVGLLSLDRAPRNALTLRSLKAIASSLNEYNEDPEINAILIHSTQKCFSVGMAASALEDWRRELERGGSAYSGAVSATLRAFSAGAKPVVCAVNGAALGGGCELALLSDVAVAAESAVFGFPEAGLGLGPGLGASWLLPRAVGRQRALEMLLTGRKMAAAEAERAGLVCRVVRDELLWPNAVSLAKSVAKKQSNASAAIKRCVYQSEFSAGAKWFEECAEFERKHFERLLAQSGPIEE